MAASAFKLIKQLFRNGVNIQEIFKEMFLLWIKSILIHEGQHEPDTIQYESTRINTSLTQVNTSPTRVNTNQHESDTSQHESTRADTSQHESTRVNTSQLDQKSS